MIRINVSRADATLTETETLTEGRVGLRCAFTFGEEWNGLQKIAYFEGSDARSVAMVDGDEVEVPWECLASAGYKLNVGVRGDNASGDTVIPTVWVRAGKIVPSPDSGIPEGEEPTPSVVAQIQQAAANALLISKNVAEQAESGAFKGDKGDTGEQGPQGETGDPGVYIGEEEPDDPEYTVWIDTSGNPDYEPFHGIPTGGNSGQVLCKSSDTDYDVEWVDEEGGTITVDDEISPVSENPVQNKVIRTALENKADVMAESFTVSGNNVSLARSFSYVISRPNNVYRFFSSSGSLIEMGYFRVSSFNFASSPYSVTLTGVVDGDVYDIVLSAATAATNPMTGTLTKRGGGTVAVDDSLSGTSENPVQNKVIKAALDAKGTYSKPSGGIPASDLASGVIPTVPTKTSDLTNDSGFVNAAGAAAAAPVQSVNGSTGAVTVSMPTKTSDLTNDSGFLTAHQSLSAYRTSAAQDTIDAGKADKVTEVTVSTAGAVSQALDAGKIYHFTGALTALTITLNAAGSGQLAQYHFDFTMPSTAFTPTLTGITMPDGHTWAASKRYEVDVLNNYGVVMAWS